jgi:aspartate carbamoyltransferase catalytic subunit
MPLSFKHLTSTKQLSRADTDAILKEATEMEKVVEKGGDKRLDGKILASLFYEPSTRTRLSFETAMQRLGGQIITADGFQFSSLYKGESIEDTMMMVSQYADIIAMRHPEQGSADIAAGASLVPFINAGDGPGQHPTQALLDLFTIYKERGRTEDLTIAMVGDLKFGRTVHSLTYLLGLYKKLKFVLVSPPELTMPEKVTSFLQEKKIPYEEVNSLEAALDADVLYMTRIQKERFKEAAEYERLKSVYTLSANQLTGKNVSVLHPLPRVGEIATDVDTLPNAAYFRQAKNGVPVRMALLWMLLNQQ